MQARTTIPAARRNQGLSPSRRRQASRHDSLRHHRGAHLVSAKVHYDIGDRLLKVHVSLRPRQLAGRLRDQLVGQNETSAERIARVLHAEILGDEGPDSFLIRLVRRPRNPEMSKVAQFVIRVPGNELHLDEEPGEYDRGYFNPGKFVCLFRNAAECVVLLSGHDILLSTLYHDGEVHRLGQDRREDDARVEVVDIN